MYDIDGWSGQATGLEARSRAALRAHLDAWASARTSLAGEPSAAYDDAPAGPAGDARPAAPADLPGPGTLAGEVDALAAAVERLASQVDVHAARGRELLDAAVVLQQLGDRVAAVKLAVLAEADMRGSATLDGSASTAAWYRARTRLAPAEAARQVRTGVRLSRFPKLKAALAAGTVTVDHATTVCTAAIPRRVRALASVEDTLVDLAHRGTPRDLARAIKWIRDAVDPDGADAPPLDESGPDERRALHLHGTLAGVGDAKATLDILTYEKLASLIDAYERPDAPDTPEGQRRSAAQRRHDALDAILDAAIANPTTPTVHGRAPGIIAAIDLAALIGADPHQQRLAALRALLDTPDTTADQLAAILGEAITTPTTTRPDTAAATGAHIDPVTASATRPAHTTAGPPGRRAAARLRYAGPVPPAVVRRLVDTATITALVTMGPWRAVTVGRTMRTLPAWLRTILHLTHSHCRGPDCDLPPTWTQAHHQTAWADGGDTDLNQTIPVCDTHHGFITNDGWTATLNLNDGTVAWTDPHGKVHITHPTP